MIYRKVVLNKLIFQLTFFTFYVTVNYLLWQFKHYYYDNKLFLSLCLCNYNNYNNKIFYSYRIEKAMTANMLKNSSLENEIIIKKKIIHAVDIHRKAIKLVFIPYQLWIHVIIWHFLFIEGFVRFRFPVFKDRYSIWQEFVWFVWASIFIK